MLSVNPRTEFNVLPAEVATFYAPLQNKHYEKECHKANKIRCFGFFDTQRTFNRFFFNRKAQMPYKLVREKNYSQVQNSHCSEVI